MFTTLVLLTYFERDVGEYFTLIVLVEPDLSTSTVEKTICELTLLKREGALVNYFSNNQCQSDRSIAGAEFSGSGSSPLSKPDEKPTQNHSKVFLNC